MSCWLFVSRWCTLGESEALSISRRKSTRMLVRGSLMVGTCWISAVLNERCSPFAITLCRLRFLQVFAVFTLPRHTSQMPKAKRGGVCPWSCDADGINRRSTVEDVGWRSREATGFWIEEYVNVDFTWGSLFQPSFLLFGSAQALAFQRLLPQWWEGRDWTVAPARREQGFYSCSKILLLAPEKVRWASWNC